jgi:hypothetical protein
MALVLATVLSGGCSANYQGAPTKATSSSLPSRVSASSPASVSVPAGQRYQGVVLGPVTVPWAPKDQAVRLFAENPDLIRALETSVPASLAGDADGGRLIVVIRVVGAKRFNERIDVYANVWAQWWSIDRHQLVSEGGSLGEAAIHFRREGARLRLTGIERPSDGAGYAPSLRKIMPAWAIERARLDDRAQRPMEDSLWRCALEWAAKQAPPNLFAEQPRPDTGDAHSHNPPSERFKMLDLRYVPMRISRAKRPAASDIEHGAASADGRFRIEYSLTGGVGTLLSDAKTGAWYALDAPGDSDVRVTGSVSFDPAWRGHTLFIDYSTVAGAPYRPTVTHYEIDCDAMSVRRAVPMGPLSMNPAQ